MSLLQSRRQFFAGAAASVLTRRELRAREASAGMAATDALIRILVRPGDHVILGNDAYGGTYRLLNNDYGEWGLELSIVDTSDLDAVAAAIRPNTKLIWLETPTNPALTVTDTVLTPARTSSSAF